ncbi:hypothetical protein, partial [Tenacibaculum finnmarkense]|uniref:hypothetical protein n=1 Tax=Tenacibaculum finnmarkense TaxID=2781243 RepID=UPI001EFB718A
AESGQKRKEKTRTVGNKIYNLLLVRTYLRKSLGDFLFRFYLLNLVLQKCNKPYINRYVQGKKNTNAIKNSNRRNN